MCHCINQNAYTCQIPFIAQHVDLMKFSGLAFVLPEENKRNLFKLTLYKDIARITFKVLIENDCEIEWLTLRPLYAYLLAYIHGS